MANIEDKITSLTSKQIEILSKLVDAPGRSLMFSDSQAGGIISSLSKLGLIKRFGKVGAASIWRINDGVLSTIESRNLLKQLAETSQMIEPIQEQEGVATRV